MSDDPESLALTCEWCGRPTPLRYCDDVCRRADKTGVLPDESAEGYPSVTDDVPRWTQEEIDRASERTAELRKVIRVLPPTEGYPSVSTDD